MSNPCLLRLSDRAKNDLKILFLAKWAEGDGTPDSVDGTHATYHHELRTTLESIGLNVEASGRYERLMEPMDADFVFTLFNRGGFVNSEMLAPLLLRKAGIAHLGAAPIIRGLTDDKHLMKYAVRGRGVQTPDWEIYRRGGLGINPPSFKWDRVIVKPNASSASWGIKAFDNWDEAKAHIEWVHSDGHDAIVERFVKGQEFTVPVIGADGPWVMPVIKVNVPDPDVVRSYEQKRNLDPEDNIQLLVSKDEALTARLRDEVQKVLPEIWPFDYGRFEFKYDAETDELNFIELNLSCNLWSTKSMSVSFRSFGRTHAELVETIVAHSLLRQGVISKEDVIKESF